MTFIICCLPSPPFIHVSLQAVIDFVSGSPAKKTTFMQLTKIVQPQLESNMQLRKYLLIEDVHQHHILTFFFLKVISKNQCPTLQIDNSSALKLLVLFFDKCCFLGEISSSSRCFLVFNQAKHNNSFFKFAKDFED